MEDVMGEKDVITLRVGEKNIFSSGKAYKRIVNGPEDDIWLYYSVLAEEVLKTKDE